MDRGIYGEISARLPRPRPIEIVLLDFLIKNEEREKEEN